MTLHHSRPLSVITYCGNRKGPHREDRGHVTLVHHSVRLYDNCMMNETQKRMRSEWTWICFYLPLYPETFHAVFKLFHGQNLNRKVELKTWQRVILVPLIETVVNEHSAESGGRKRMDVDGKLHTRTSWSFINTVTRAPHSTWNHESRSRSRSVVQAKQTQWQTV